MACNNLFGGNSCSWIILLLVLSCFSDTLFSNGNGSESAYSNNGCGCGC